MTDDSAVTTAKQVTELLQAWREGDGARSPELLAAVYRELKRIAHRQLARERQGHTLQTTALVHEAYLRLVDQTRVSWRDRGHFFAVAATLMRRVLVDYARGRLAGKRAGEVLTLSAAAAAAGDGPAVAVLDLDRALAALTTAFPRQARVVELRYFGGLELTEIAAVLEVTDRTVKRDWAFARAWLAREIERAPAGDGG